MKNALWRRWFNSVGSTELDRPDSRTKTRRQPLCLRTLEDRVTPTLTPQMVLDINTNTLSANPSQLVAIGPTAYFTADDGVNGLELWKTDGTSAGTMLVKDIR